MEELLYQLIELVRETAPALWQIARRQVMVEAIGNIIAILLCIAVIVAYWRVQAYAASLRKAYSDKYNKECGHENPSHRYTNNDNWYDLKNEGFILATFWGGGAVLGIAGLILPYLLTVIIGRLVNPDYYAIWVLLNLVK